MTEPTRIAHTFEIPEGWELESVPTLTPIIPLASLRIVNVGQLPNGNLQVEYEYPGPVDG